MIACRSLFRVDRVWTFTNAYVILNIPKPIRFSQGHCLYYGFSYNRKMSMKKDAQSAGDRNKKQKTVNRVWRPVCTQASSYEESLDVKILSVDRSQVQEACCSTSSNVSNVQDLNMEAETKNELTDSSIVFGASQDNCEDGALAGGLTCSAEKHSTSVEVGASLIRFIIGKGGSTQKGIENETGVKIIFPSSKKEELIIIEGMSAESVNKAAEKIHSTIDEAVKSPYLDYSHFVSLPLAIHPELVDKLVNFQNSILGFSDPCPDENLESDSNADTSYDEAKDKHKELDVAVELKVGDDNKHVRVDISNISLTSYPPKASKSTSLSGIKHYNCVMPSKLRSIIITDCGSVSFIPALAYTDPLAYLGIDKSIFIKPKTFHLTVLMLKLWNKDRVHAATEVLKSVSSKVIDALSGRPVSVRLKGLDCMRGSLAKARVLYAPVEEIGSEDRLLRACQVIIDAYVEAGLVLEKDAKQKLKLHATIMNARHRKREKRTRELDSFDARGIVKQYGSEHWGDYLIREAHLSQRFVFDENGYYHCCASIPFPENMQAV